MLHRFGHCLQVQTRSRQATPSTPQRQTGCRHFEAAPRGVWNDRNRRSVVLVIRVRPKPSRRVRCLRRSWATFSCLVVVCSSWFVRRDLFVVVCSSWFVRRGLLVVVRSSWFVRRGRGYPGSHRTASASLWMQPSCDIHRRRRTSTQQSCRTGRVTTSGHSRLLARATRRRRVNAIIRP